MTQFEHIFAYCKDMLSLYLSLSLTHTRVFVEHGSFRAPLRLLQRYTLSLPLSLFLSPSLYLSLSLIMSHTSEPSLTRISLSLSLSLSLYLSLSLSMSHTSEPSLTLQHTATHCEPSLTRMRFVARVSHVGVKNKAVMFVSDMSHIRSCQICVK